MYYIVPIFSDPYLHPLHKDNGLSFLYVQDLDLKKEPIDIGIVYKDLVQPNSLVIGI